MTQPATYPDTIITVTSRDYLPGTQVMLHSFLSTNRWFEGTIAVLQDDLKQAEKQALRTTFPKLEFPKLSADLTAGINRLVRDVPKLGGRARRFYSLDAFHPDRDGRVLFCDSDLLFRADIGAMIERSGRIVACGDRAQIVGTGRDPITLSEGAQNDGFNSFNAGLMLIDASMRRGEVWEALLDQLCPNTWQELESEHTDQAIYNRLFGDQVVLADAAYNYLVGHADQLRDTNVSPMNDAKVLHFNGPAKPWNFTVHLDAVAADAGYIKAAEYWFAAYVKFLSAHHFATKR